MLPPLPSHYMLMAELEYPYFVHEVENSRGHWRHSVFPQYMLARTIIFLRMPHVRLIDLIAITQVLPAHERRIHFIADDVEMWVAAIDSSGRLRRL